MTKWYLLTTLIKIVLAASTQKLYYYGQPSLTTQTGFIKIDPSTGAWETVAEGFTTQSLYPTYTSSAFSSTGDDMILYGYFALWNGIYVGGLLRLNPETFEISLFNTGVLGESITGTAYYDNNTRIALAGDFYAFQQNPSVSTNQVGGCTVDGKNCYPLGSGLPGYIGAGQLVSFRNQLYVIYTTDEGTTVASFDYLNSNSDWKPIYQASGVKSNKYWLVVYRDELWMFGNIVDFNNDTKSAAKWIETNSTWVFFDSDLIMQNTSDIVTALSPDGQRAYITSADPIYVWNDTVNNWEIFYTPDCEYTSYITALNTGLVVTCGANLTFVDLNANAQLIENYNCPTNIWIALNSNPNGEVFYGYCSIAPAVMETSAYNISSFSVAKSTNISELAELKVDLRSMCVYGPKIFISGLFDEVNEIPAKRHAIWDDRTQQWYKASDTEPTVCYCSTDGKMMAAACSLPKLVTPPVLLVDYASLPSGNGSVQVYNLTALRSTPYINDVSLVDGVVYIASTVAGQNVSLFKWTASEGLEAIILSKGRFYTEFVILDNMVYLTGDFNPDNNASNTLTAARYDLLNNTWLPMDQITLVEGNKTDYGSVGDLVYWGALNRIYVGGQFTRIGSMRVWNWGGYNLDGQAADSVAGGVPDWVYFLVPIEDRMYFITRAPDCPIKSRGGCGVLMYYDGLTSTYSYPISQGVGIIASGYDTTDQASSGSENRLDTKWVIISVVSSFCGAVLLLAGGVVCFRKFTSKRSLYQEIPIFQSIDALESVDSTAPIDFAKEHFVMKSVLGRGAYGTVWSCVFPNREGQTFAVKQMLFSKGETKKIDIVQQEIDILEKFRHPHIVHYCGHRVETTQTSVEFFIFMELYDQPCSLKGVIQKKISKAQKTGKNDWFTYQEVKDFLFQISDGLNYLHHNGVAHRDLKCANILVRMKGSQVGSLHIADFGISRIMSTDEGVNVLASTVLGTPSFMAPEVLKNQPYDPFKADIWSFGMLMYEMLSWKEPQIPGHKPSFPEEVTEFVSHDPCFLAVLEIFDKSSQVDPNARPTASDLLYLSENLP